jgi:hypothetical protein
VLDCLQGVFGFDMGVILDQGLARGKHVAFRRLVLGLWQPLCQAEDVLAEPNRLKECIVVFV